MNRRARGTGDSVMNCRTTDVKPLQAMNDLPNGYRPFHGLTDTNVTSPGVPLRSTPGFMLPPAPRVYCAVKMSNVQARQTRVLNSVTLPGGKALRSSSRFVFTAGIWRSDHIIETSAGVRSLSVWPTARSSSASMSPVAGTRFLKSNSLWSNR